MAEKRVIFCLLGPIWEWYEVMRQRDGRKMVLETVGVKKDVLNMWSAKYLANIKGALYSTLYYANCAKRVSGKWCCILIFSVLFYFTFCFSMSPFSQRYASNASSEIKFEENYLQFNKFKNSKLLRHSNDLRKV